MSNRQKLGLLLSKSQQNKYAAQAAWRLILFIYLILWEKKNNQQKTKETELEEDSSSITFSFPNIFFFRSWILQSAC